MPSHLLHGFRLGPWTVEPLRGAITGPDGEAHHLEPKVMDVFVCLAEHANELVTRDGLLEAVWGKRAVSDEPLTRAIGELRRAFQNGRGDTITVETVPKRGYRLVGEVRPTDDTTNGIRFPGGQRTSRGLAALVLLVSAAFAAIFFLQTEQSKDSESDLPTLAVEPLIAIFPFEDMSVATKQQNLGRAISEGVLHRLGRSKELRTVSIAYIAALLDQELDPIEIGEKLEATLILRGSFQTQGDDIRLTINLSAQDDQSILWSDEIDDSLTNIFAMQERIANGIAASVGTVITTRSSSATRKVSTEAYRLYADAKDSYLRLELDQVVTLLTQATQLDPEFAEALGLLARALVGRSHMKEDRDGPFIKAGEDYARKALAIEPGESNAQFAIAVTKIMQYEWVAGRIMLNNLIEQTGDPNNYAWAAVTLPHLGHIDRSIELLEKTVAENPYGPGYWFLSILYGNDGQYDRALQAADLAADYGTAFNYLGIGFIHATRGDIEEATELITKHLELFGFDPDLAPEMAITMADGEVSQTLAEAMRIAASRSADFDAASIYYHVLLGFPANEVFELANRLLDERRLTVTPFFGSRASIYRKDPGFLELMERIGLAAYWRSVELPDFCHLQGGELVCN